jgi:hypothetical protein
MQQRFLKIFLKKVAKIFGDIKNSPYLCTTFRSKKEGEGNRQKWFFDLLVFYIERKV